MTATRKAPVPRAEQLELIRECRQSGLTDADWCRQNGIAVSTFYTWVSRCRKAAAGQIPAPNYGHSLEPREKQDVVPLDIIPGPFPEQHPASPARKTYSDRSYVMEVTMRDLTIRISHDADPVLLAHMLRSIREALC